MNKRQGGLGKGLSSLIPADVSGDVDAPYRDVDINSIVVNPNQPRSQFDEESLVALSASVAEVGVIQPVIVRPDDKGGFELVAGERRWRAAKRAGLQTIPALVRETDPRGSLETAIVENLHRQDLNPLEEAAAYRQLVDDFKLSQKEVARRVGRSRSAVANTIRLMQLPAAVQRLLVEGRLSAGHGRALLAVSDPDAQEALAMRAADDGLTVRQVEDLLRGEALPSEDLDDYLDQAASSAKAARAAGKAGTGGKASVPQAGVLELEEMLANRLDTTVKVQLGKGSGRVVVSFADLDDLERIYRIITPHAPSNN